MFIEHGAWVQKKGERAPPEGNHPSEPRRGGERWGNLSPGTKGDERGRVSAGPALAVRHNSALSPRVRCLKMQGEHLVSSFIKTHSGWGLGWGTGNVQGGDGASCKCGWLQVRLGFQRASPRPILKLPNEYLF